MMCFGFVATNTKKIRRYDSMLLLYDVLYVGLCVSDSSCVQLLSEAPWVVPFSAIHVKDSTKLRA